MKISQKDINSYASISGDHNPIHLDYEYARTTQFKSCIAHGMMSLAIVTEMLEIFFGKNLYSNSEVKTKFTAPVLPNETIKTFGEILSINLNENKKNIICKIGCKKDNGETVIEGKITVTI